MPNLELGKYAGYILPAYAITVVIVAAIVADTLARTARWKREAERLGAERDKKRAG